MVLIFDFDGVICDSYEAVLFALQVFSKEDNLLSNIDEVNKLRGLDFLKVLQIFNIEHFQIETAVAYIKKFLANKMDTLNVVSGVKEILNELQRLDIKMGIITSNSRENVIKFLKNHDVNGFNFIVPAGFSNKGKIIKEVILKEQYEPKKVFYIGDEVRDILASQIAEVKSIAVGWGFNNKELLLKHNPDYYIDTPKDFFGVMQELSSMEFECK